MLRCIKLLIVVAPLVVILFGNFTRLQHGNGLLPGAHLRTFLGSPAPYQDISVSFLAGDGKSESVRQSPYHPLQTLVVLRERIAKMLSKVKKILNCYFKFEVQHFPICKKTCESVKYLSS